jgi:signal transduction histidine kinase
MPLLLGLADDPRDLPTRIRVGTAAVPVTFAGIAFAAHPVAWVAAAAVVTVSPWLLTIARVPLPGWLCSLVPIAGAAWLMADWPHTDISLMLLVYLVGQQATLLRPALSLATWSLAVSVPIGWDVGGDYARSVGWVIGMMFAWSCGFAFRKQQEAMEQLQEAQQELSDKAVTDERRRIAREVHDLVAHSLAVTMLHLTGARLALADGETAEAEAALAAAEDLGRSSMTGIRRAVGLLSDTGDATNWGPEPDERDVVMLIEDYRRAGVDVRLSVRGTPSTLEPSAGLAVYRLLQESLANAVRHAPGQPVSIELRWDPDALSIRVVNSMVGPPTTAPIGHGLLGMRERSDQLGASFTAGPTGDEEWHVHVVLTLAADAEATSR